MENFDTLLQMAKATPPVNISSDERQVLAVKIRQEIDAWSSEYYMDDFRWHMGASIIGNECDRAIWYTFRWASKDTRNGRMKRLHNRGKDEEAKINQYLRGIGFNLWDTDPDTGKQFRISFHKGHFGGSSDGLFTLPFRYNTPGFFVPEYKTSMTGAAFNNYEKKGVAIHKENYFLQHSIYGYGFGVENGMFLASNKNDDDIYIEFVKLDFQKAEAGIRRAGNLIVTDYAPAKINDKVSFYLCAMCDHKDVCHNGVSMAINCRSCVYAEPVDKGEWQCNRVGQVIPREFVPQGCDKYMAIK